MQITLTNPTDDELSAAVAEYVAGWVNDGSYWGWRLNSGQVKRRCDLPPYATSADAVLPLLEKYHAAWLAQSVINGCTVVITATGYERFYGNSPTFPRAACIALLRANGVEVVA